MVNWPTDGNSIDLRGRNTGTDDQGYIGQRLSDLIPGAKYQFEFYLAHHTWPNENSAQKYVRVAVWDGPKRNKGTKLVDRRLEVPPPPPGQDDAGCNYRKWYKEDFTFRPTGTDAYIYLADDSASGWTSGMVSHVSVER